MESQKADSSVGCGSTKEKDATATPPACRYPHCVSETKPNCTVDTKPRNAGNADECQRFRAMKCIIPRDHHAAASRGHTLLSSRPHLQRTRSVKGLVYVSHNSSAANPTDLCHHLTHTCIAATLACERRASSQNEWSKDLSVRARSIDVASPNLLESQPLESLPKLELLPPCQGL